MNVVGSLLAQPISIGLTIWVSLSFRKRALEIKIELSYTLDDAVLP